MTTWINTKSKVSLVNRKTHDEYLTPPHIVRFIYEQIKLEEFFEKDQKINFLDYGAGPGIWGNELKKIFPEAKLTGVEIQPKYSKGNYDTWYTQSYVGNDYGKYDLICSNPPFIYSEQAILQGWNALNNEGVMVMLLRTDYPSSQKRAKKIFLNPELMPLEEYGFSSRICFDKDKGEPMPTNFSVFVWNKDGHMKDGWIKRMLPITDGGWY